MKFLREKNKVEENVYKKCNEDNQFIYVMPLKKIPNVIGSKLYTQV